MSQACEGANDHRNQRDCYKQTNNSLYASKVFVATNTRGMGKKGRLKAGCGGGRGGGVMSSGCFTLSSSYKTHELGSWSHDPTSCSLARPAARPVDLAPPFSVPSPLRRTQNMLSHAKPSLAKACYSLFSLPLSLSLYACVSHRRQLVMPASSATSLYSMSISSRVSMCSDTNDTGTTTRFLHPLSASSWILLSV